MRVSFIVIRFLVAASVDSFVALSSLVSSLFCVCNNILFPIAAFHYVGVEQVSTRRKIAHAICFGYGCFIMIVGTVSSFAALMPSEVHKPGSVIREGITAACIAASRI